ncbi:uncharacterized protein HMPREF1541_06401 [Cyphellophora europaea CBS 101466]|uniref:Restriction of telomere capping protein 5 n=1 Tax=Cyphellophora europaea (strain CBS 101466) TaxID=1220924 RepID=W2RPE2_CYPE1|nr:uncharacterized protein HMPREF1541_06401 [Cyphellophora europaea CBS 101466]ETN38366.1 hypothetical protein HMPREF1541_06401 [Cyphellophora europaea CBS 101466]
MGQSQSSEPPRQVPIEQLSHELALRFASKCYSHLEITHYKDNFKSLADHQDALEYWKEDTINRFLCLPEALRAGPVIHQMCTYLGAFPFPTLAPCILTREAMIKVITIMTGRYKKVLKRGNRDKAKLLFRSLAVFDRRASIASLSEKPSMKDIIDEQKPDQMLEEEAAAKDSQPRVGGFAIDQPANDDEDEDDDDLALAALDSLDAIEVFKQDQVQKIDKKMIHAMIPTDNFRRLIMLLLLYGGLKPQSNLSEYGDSLDDSKLKQLEDAASSIVEAFEPDTAHNGIRYSNFVKVLSTTMPDTFEPLNALFEHFMFSKNINLSAHKGEVTAAATSVIPKTSLIYPPSDSTTSLLTETLLSQLSMSIHLGPAGSSPTNIYSSDVRFNQLFSTSSNGTSLSSFSRQVTSWETSTLLVISGTNATSEPIILGAYLPDRWRDSSTSHKEPSGPDASAASRACFFQLAPRHAIFPANPANRHIPISYFSNKTGIAIGCVVPPQPRSSAPPAPPVPGPASLTIDTDIATATFQHDLDAGQGAFVPDPGLCEAQAREPAKYPAKQTFEIDTLEIWGVSFPGGGGGDELERHRKKLEWEEAEAARRRGVNFGGDKDGARHLLEMAGIVDQNRSGGSMG